jgi:outer membrane protein assembly factor BamB
VVADGRLFLKYGSFYVFDLRAELPVDGQRRDGMGQAANAAPPIKWWRESNVLWTATLPGTGMASPVTNAGKVFAACDGGGLACVDSASGTVLWKQTLTVADAKGAPAATCVPIVRDKSVFVAFANGAAGCYDLSGKLVWSGLLGTAEGATPLSSPVLSEKTVVLQGARLSALNAETGELAWTLDVPKGAANTTPTKYRMDDTNVLITSWGAIVRAADGKVLWEAKPAVSGVVAIVADGVLYLRGVRDGKGIVQALKLPAKAEEGMKLELQWEAPAAAGRLDAMVAANGQLYTLDAVGVLTALDVATGTQVYAEPALVRIGVRRDIKALGLVAAGGLLYATINDETIVVKPGKAFEQVWKYEVRNGAAEAAFAGGVQFLRGGDRLYAIGGETPAAPVEPEMTPLAPAVVGADAATPIAPFASDLCPPKWVVAGPFAGRDLEKDYLAGLGGRAVAVPKVGDVAKLGGEQSPFRALPDGAWWTGGRFTNDMKAVIVANGEPTGGASSPKALNATQVFGTVIENDAPRYVRFRFLTPDGISWNYKQRLDGQMWLAGKPVNEKTVYWLEKGRYPLLIQATVGDVEGWGKIWMCPRLVDCTPEIDRKLAAYRKLKAGWDNYQAALKTTFVLSP